MLRGKTAFITGASRGIGLEIANTFAKHGANLILNARNEEKLSQTADKIKKGYKTNVEIIPFDVASYEETKNAFKKIHKITKKLDIVVNNAGILENSLISMVKKENIEKVYSTNVFSIYYILSFASRFMIKNKNGSIINITSIMGTNGEEGVSVYSGSKSAIIGITKSLSKELAPFNIRVNAIAPGFIQTDMTNNLPKEIYEKRIESIKMKKIGTPKDVANVALFLASYLSEYVTGQIIGVDGGMVL